MIMGHFGMLRFYLKGFYETILAYASVKLLPVGQRNPVSFNVYSSISNLTFFVAREPFDARRALLKKTELVFIVIVSRLLLKEKTSLENTLIDYLLKYYPEYQMYATRTQI
jgi:hypothetical protein